jgi:hypothetical protein
MIDFIRVVGVQNGNTPYPPANGYLLVAGYQRLPGKSGGLLWSLPKRYLHRQHTVPALTLPLRVRNLRLST